MKTHEEVEKYTSRRCDGKSSDRAGLNPHKKLQCHSVFFPCSCCLQSFDSENDLVEHLNTRHGLSCDTSAETTVISEDPLDLTCKEGTNERSMTQEMERPGGESRDLVHETLIKQESDETKSDEDKKGYYLEFIELGARGDWPCSSGTPNELPTAEPRLVKRQELETGAKDGCDMDFVHHFDLIKEEMKTEEDVSSSSPCKKEYRYSMSE
ncbi:hypothetical protein QAD02_009410 [Eretmocerus hayati]|uniref:Uncharacterized protein n=1 Tax=Eretmocerus hayati TaxID=131215 RepID=A0ACC2N9J0_9HYME|nr:hypothetical protein QAD02_009410 [Eretmocerus hayati]